MKGQSIDQVILCGGASLMDWLQEDVRKLFSETTDIQHLDASDFQYDPSFTVADGLIKYSAEDRNTNTAPERTCDDLYGALRSELYDCAMRRSKSLENTAYTGMHSWDLDKYYDSEIERIYGEHMPSLLKQGHILACREFYEFLSKKDQIKADRFAKKFLHLHPERSLKDLTGTPVWDHVRQIASPEVQIFGDTMKKLFGK